MCGISHVWPLESSELLWCGGVVELLWYVGVLEGYVRVYILNGLRRNDVVSHSRVLAENEKQRNAIVLAPLRH